MGGNDITEDNRATSIDKRENDHGIVNDKNYVMES